MTPELYDYRETLKSIRTATNGELRAGLANRQGFQRTVLMHNELNERMWQKRFKKTGQTI